MADKLPGNGVMGWLGRQIGYVRQAVKARVGEEAAGRPVYRETRVEEQPHPSDPSLTLRRTITDEAIKKPQ